MIAINPSKLPLLLIPLAALGCTDRHHPNYYVENRGGFTIRVSPDGGKLSDPIAPHQTKLIGNFYSPVATLHFVGPDGKQDLGTIGAPNLQRDTALDGNSGWESRVTFIYP